MLEYVLIGAAIFDFILAGGALAYYIYSNPIKLVGLGTALLRAVWPHLRAFVLKRMSPEEEAKWREEQKNSANPPGMRSKFPRRER